LNTQNPIYSSQCFQHGAEEQFNLNKITFVT